MNTPAGPTCANITNWGEHNNQCVYVDSSDYCACQGKGGVENLVLWGPKGEYCAGIATWGTYKYYCD